MIADEVCWARWRIDLVYAAQDRRLYKHGRLLVSGNDEIRLKWSKLAYERARRRLAAAIGAVAFRQKGSNEL